MNFLQCSKSGRAGRGEARRDHILQVARRLFGERGFHATGVAQIATESGVGVGQIYRDFANKEEIIAAIVGNDLERFLQEEVLTQAAAAGNVGAVRDWLSHFFDEDVDNQKLLMPEILAEAVRNPRISDLQEAIEQRVRGTIATALDVLAPGASDHAKDRFIDLVLTLGIGLHHRRLSQPGRATADLTALFVDIVDTELATLSRCSRPTPP